MTIPIRILLVDDNALFLGAAIGFLRTQEGLRVIASFRTMQEALFRLRELKPDVILLDLNMPDGSGLEAIAELRAAAPQAKIIILTMLAQESYRVAALQAGAHEFVAKGTMGADLLPAIQRAMQTPGEEQA